MGRIPLPDWARADTARPGESGSPYAGGMGAVFPGKGPAESTRGLGGSKSLPQDGFTSTPASGVGLGSLLSTHSETMCLGCSVPTGKVPPTQEW